MKVAVTVTLASAYCQSSKMRLFNGGVLKKSVHCGKCRVSGNGAVIKVFVLCFHALECLFAILRQDYRQVVIFYLQQKEGPYEMFCTCICSQSAHLPNRQQRTDSDGFSSNFTAGDR